MLALQYTKKLLIFFLVEILNFYVGILKTVFIEVDNFVTVNVMLFGIWKELKYFSSYKELSNNLVHILLQINEIL